MYYYNNGAFYKRILDYQKTYIAPTLYELTSGKLPDGTKLQWMYLKDFIEQNKENINDIDEYINQHMVKVS